MMESLHNLKNKFVWDMVGHSGDSPEIVLAAADSPPSNEMERYKGNLLCLIEAVRFR